jgi:hypothetical protein
VVFRVTSFITPNMTTNQVRTIKVCRSTPAAAPTSARPNMTMLNQITVVMSPAVMPSSITLPTTYGPMDPGSHSPMPTRELSSRAGACCHISQPMKRLGLRVSGSRKSREPIRVGRLAPAPPRSPERAAGVRNSGTTGGKSCMTAQLYGALPIVLHRFLAAWNG